MKENLNIGVMIDSAVYQSNNSILEKYCYNNNPTNCVLYGGLYSWNEMMQYSTTAGTQGICPTGWHLPSDPEWCTLTTYLEPTVSCLYDGSSGTLVGGKMKNIGFTYWNSPNTNATNESGFNARGSGFNQNGTFYWLKDHGYFWTSSLFFMNYSVYRTLYNDMSTIGRGYIDQTVFGLSVRCVKN
ncbi:MAG: fibrobacter succinogenes major paralogous domain-containing protein [Bacteroidota bacterium]